MATHSPLQRSLGFAVVVVGLSACVGSTMAGPDASVDGAQADTGAPPRIEVGGGLLEFAPFGDEAEMVRGSQDGWHIDVATRFHNIDAIDLELIIEGFDVETGEQVTRTVDRFLQERHTTATQPGVRTRVGDRLILDITEPSDIEGRTVRVRAMGLSQGGVRAMGEANVVVVDRDL